MAKQSIRKYHDRELSWLAFNARVLQEAADPGVPVLERLKFLAIFSSNLDEFFRVRVAALRSLLRLKKKVKKRLDFNPAKLLREIHREVVRQQRIFGDIFANEVLPALRQEGISFSFGDDLSAPEDAFVEKYFREQVASRLQPEVLKDGGDGPFLQNRGIYLVTELWAHGEHSFVVPASPRYGLVPLQADALPRFVELPADGELRRVMFIDDIVRANIDRLFPGFDCGEAFSIKMTRDAELYLDDEFSGDLVDMIRKSLSERDQGMPTRFLYDLHMPYPMVSALKSAFGLADEDLVLGGRYHNFSDFFAFPDFGRADLAALPMPPLDHPRLSFADPVLDAIERSDLILHYPYQSFDPIVRLFEEAAEDPGVREIRISLYRVAANSRIAKALIRAAQRGADVTAFVEVKARFDEEPNLKWAEEMERAGVQVLYSLPGLKVHCKAAVITRDRDGVGQHFTCLSTGNFNEVTARTYTDHALLTTRVDIAEDVLAVFDFLSGNAKKVSPKVLAVAPFNLRRRFNALIDREISNAKAGKDAWILAKMNSLEDRKIVDRLYLASNVGVKIRLIVRGLCTLVPGIPGLSENIRVTSIVDRFLEHARVFVFANDNAPVTYLGSADWMSRNLGRRVEIVFPVFSREHSGELEDILLLQCRDNRKAREIDEGLRNRYAESGEDRCRAQIDTYSYVAGLLTPGADREHNISWQLIDDYGRGPSTEIPS